MSAIDDIAANIALGNAINLNHPLHGFKIQTIRAFIVTDEKGEEGLPAISLRNGMMTPLLSADPTRFDEMTKIAEAMAKTYNLHINVYEFTTRTLVKEIKP